MADEQDDSQKTEEPTQRRLDDAEKKGDIVKSQEVSTFVVLAGVTLVIALLGPSTAKGLTRIFRVFLEQPDQILLGGGGVMVLMRTVLMQVGIVLAPVFGLMIAAGLAGHLLQHKPVFSAEKLKPSLSKLSLIKGFQRMFGLDGMANLAKGLLKMCIVGSVVWIVLWPQRGRMGEILDQAPVQIAGDMSYLLIKMLLAALAVLAVIAVGDYFLQRYQFLKRNRMSKQEIKDEFKQTEGDPVIKAKVKQIRQERSRRRMMAAVPDATVIITNPTHFAVALKYESGEMAAPICVAKGMDALALRIREVATENDVPIIENPPLARALYATVEIDDVIPAEHFKAVAQVIGYVMRLNGQIRD
ncbi:MAG TPA: flagellar biosynthesis protein FlhB [Rhizomicrobium sp.]|nr:flagellar biosynthesis protein FlhB [Rhizomicrobium sp.]